MLQNATEYKSVKLSPDQDVNIQVISNKWKSI